MGNIRVVAEHALQEVVELLQRARCSHGVVRETRNRLLALVATIAALDADRATAVHQEPAAAVCGHLLGDIVAHVLDREIPARDVVRWEARYVAETRTVRQLRLDVDDLEAQVATLTGGLERRAEASHYLMGRYFKEVLALRRDAAAVKLRHEQQRLLQRPEMLQRRQRRSFGSASPDGSPPTSPVPTPRASVHEADSSTPQRAAPALNVIPRSPTTGTPRTVAAAATDRQGTNTEAVFDYTEFLAVVADSKAQLAVRLIALQEEHGACKAAWAAEREAIVGNYSAQLELKNQQLAVLRDGSGHFTGVIGKVREQLRREVTHAKVSIKHVKGLVKAQRDFALGQKLKIGETLQAMAENVAMLARYCERAAELIVAQAAAGAGATDAKRAALEAVLLPSDSDSAATRSNKLYWRKHDVAGKLLAAVVAVHRMGARGAEMTKRMQTLTDFSLTEAAQAAKLTKLRRDKVGEMEQNRMLLASLSEAARVSADRSFWHKLFAAAADADHPMDAADRAVIVAAHERHRAWVRAQLRGVRERVRHRGVVTRLRYAFELRDKAYLDPAFPDLLAQSEHLQRLVDGRFGAIAALTLASETYATNIRENATAMVCGLGGATVHHVLHGELDDEHLSASQLAPPARGKQLLKKKVKQISYMNRLKLSDAGPAAAARRPSVHSRRGSVRSQFSESLMSEPSEQPTLSEPRPPTPTVVAVPVLHRPPMQLMPAHVADDDSNAPMIITPTPPQPRFIPTMGGIGTSKAQQRSVQVLVRASGAIGCTNPAAKRRPNTAQRLQGMTHEYEPWDGSGDKLQVDAHASMDFGPR
jgi:hypothetical protein